MVKLEFTTAEPSVVAFKTDVPLIANLSPEAKLTPSVSIVCSVVPSIDIVTELPDPVSLMLMLESFLAIELTPTLPEILTLPGVLMSPVAASIVKAPTVSPLWTTKFLLAIDPYLLMCYIHLFMLAKKIAPWGAIFNH